MVWKRLYDAVEGRVAPVLDDLARNDDVLTAAALLHRARTGAAGTVERTSRRVLHLLNLPAGSDVNRLLAHIARLEAEVGALRQALGDRELEAFLADVVDEGGHQQPVANPDGTVE